MENLEIKRLNDELYININDLLEFQKIYSELEEKINLIKEQDKSNLLYINIELGNRDITSQDLFCLYELFLKDEKFLIKSIKYNSLNTSQIEVYKGSIRGGETKYFNNSVIILGDINPNALVVVKDEIYVVGKVKGKIIVRNKNGAINAASYINACVKIFDLLVYDVNFSHVKVLDYQFLSDNGGKMYV